MLPLLSDEDLQGAIVAGLLLHFPAIDLVRVQDVGLMQTPDPIILELAASQNRVVVTHDRNTMTVHAQDRMNQGLRHARADCSGTVRQHRQRHSGSGNAGRGRRNRRPRWTNPFSCVIDMPTKICLFLAIVALLTLHAPATPNSPSSASIASRRSAGSPARKSTLDIAGRDLEDAKTLHFDHPGLKATVAQGSPVQGRDRADMPPGTYEVRAVGRFGISGTRLFSVQRGLIEVAEKEPNDDPDKAQVVPMNCAINATSDNNGDDFCRFPAKKGERITIDCFAFRLDSQMTPMLAPSDSAAIRYWPDFKGSVQLIALNLPPGVTFATTTVAADSTQTPIRINIAANVPPGEYTVVLRGDAQAPFNRDPAAPVRPNVRVADPTTPMAGGHRSSARLDRLRV